MKKKKYLLLLCLALLAVACGIIWKSGKRAADARHYYSDFELRAIVDELNKRTDTLTDERLKENLSSWGPEGGYVYVYFIFNTPEARRAFREKLIDSPAIRFGGPERPAINERVAPSDTLGVSLRPEYSVYADTVSCASFLLINQSGQRIECGDYYSVTYEDERGTWRTLPTCQAFFDIAYLIETGSYWPFHARLYPLAHPNKPGRYRFFYDVSVGQGDAFTMMTEFRLTDNEQEVKKAVRTEIPK